jgi:hypothetical protein
MNARQKIEAFLIVLFAFIAFAAYHEGTGSTAWIQWLTVVVLLFYTFVFDMSFSGDSTFVFDPDADNWRRKTEAH